MAWPGLGGKEDGTKTIATRGKNTTHGGRDNSDVRESLRNDAWASSGKNSVTTHHRGLRLGMNINKKKKKRKKKKRRLVS